MAAVAAPANDLDIDQRREAAAALRAEGLSYSAIGDALGVDTATAHRAEQEARMAEHVSRALKLAEAHPCASEDVVRRTRLLQFILDGSPGGA